MIIWRNMPPRTMLDALVALAGRKTRPDAIDASKDTDVVPLQRRKLAATRTEDRTSPRA